MHNTDIMANNKYIINVINLGLPITYGYQKLDYFRLAIVIKTSQHPISVDR